MLLLIFKFPILVHPLAMGLKILCLTILSATTLSMMMSSLSISYALIFVLLGGLLVGFIYFSLLSSN